MCKIMKNKLQLVFFVNLLLFVVNQAYTIDNNNWPDKVSPELIMRFEKVEKENFLVYMNDQIKVPEINDKKEVKAEKAYRMLLKNLETQEDIISMLTKGKYEFKRFFIVNAILVYGDRKLLVSLASRNDVSYISHDFAAAGTFIDPAIPVTAYSPEPTWGISMIRADEVWEMGYRGQGIVVGGQDTGYDWKHPALMKKYRGFKGDNNADHNYNWHDAIHEISPLNNDSLPSPQNNPCGLDSREPCDDGSHGTHTMGTIAGSTDTMLIGVAPESRWIGCRNMERGWGKPSTYIECFEWFMAPTDLEGKNPDPGKAPDVINNSWGCPEIEGCDPGNWNIMETALNNLRASGVFVVVSAGNSGINNCGSINDPTAMYEKAFTVGATRERFDTVLNVSYDTIASYSSRGPVIIDGSFRLKPDISAPGSKVLSSVPRNKYAYSNGTSMAGPHVTGVVALLLSANPELRGNTDKIEEILKSTADPKPETDNCTGVIEKLVPNTIFGYGRINAMAAVNKALEIKTSVEPDRKTIKNYEAIPNPSSDRIKINGINNLSETKVCIIDRFGKEIITHHGLSSNEIQLGKLKSGLYFIKIIEEGAVEVIKIVKR